MSPPLGLAAAAALLLWAHGAHAEEPPALRGARPGPIPQDAPAEASPQRSAEELQRERSRQALERGLAWLAKEQRGQLDGSFPRGGAREYVPLPVTALAALAFMAGGSTPGRGVHGAAIERAVDYLLQRADLVPDSPNHGYLSTEGDRRSQMHGHAYATLALTQAYAMSPRSARGQRTAKVLRAAVDLIERSQGVEGGWFYEPHRSVQHENSVTVCLVQALRAAHDVGIDVDSKVIARAVEYIRRCQNEDGSFRYGLVTPASTMALTAAGLTILHSAGHYEGNAIDRGMQALWQRLDLRASGALPAASYAHYERFYVAQALWHSSDERLFERWAAGERTSVLASQLPDGSWSNPDFGPAYATAMCCLFLALPDGLLPVFQR